MNSKENIMKNKNVFIISIFISLLLIAMSGCIGKEKVDESTLPRILNEFGEREISFTNKVDDFIIITKYYTPYNASHWKITDSKVLIMEAWLKSPINGTVFVEHVHCDISVKSTLASYNGWTQDTMDDTIHGSLQPGFFINDTYKYQNVFAIEGLTERVLSGYMIGVYGYASGFWEEETITESDFVEYGGVYGEKIQAVFDIVVKYPYDEFYHVYSFDNEFIVAVE